jgi:cyclic pyranopterin phosphate synthase
MPANAVPRSWTAMKDDDIVEVVEAAASLGITKFRITGGEPLVRPGIVDLCARIHDVKGVKEVTMTTNGTRLKEMAKDLKAAGINRVNISLDTLDEKKFRQITRGGDINKVLEGMDAAFAAGMDPIKLNTVLIGGFNDDEIFKLAELTRSCPLDVRFIELMPIGDVHQFPEQAYIPCSVVLEKVPELVRINDKAESSVTRLYKLNNGRGRVGLISPLSCDFCGSCNRLRLTADGCLKPCLHSFEEIHIKGLHGSELQWALKLAIAHKPKAHAALSATERSQSRRDMNRIGG